MKLTLDQLRALCRAKGLAVSGNKSELVSRLVNYTPEEHDDAPTQKQLDYIVVLERKANRRAPAKAYTSRRAATEAIKDLKGE